MNIIQGDNGISIPFVVQKYERENLDGAVVRVVIKQGTDINVKQARIANAQSGRCELILSTADLAVVGAYSYQWTAYFPDGRIYSGKPVSFTVTELYVSVDGGDDPSETFILPFATKNDLASVQAEVDALAEIVEQGGGGGQGPKGDKGDPGEQGQKGDQGLQGERGPKGDTGAKGDAGLKGDQGIQGERGLQGIQGIPGLKGDKGDAGTNGLDGRDGERGIKGDKGEKGDKGDSWTSSDRNVIVAETDCFQPNGLAPWSQSTHSGGQVNAGTSGTSKHPGVVSLAPQSAGGISGSLITTAQNALDLSGGEKATHIVQFGPGSQTSIIRRIGFQSSFGYSVEPTFGHGVYVEAVDGVISGRTASNSIRSETTSSFTTTNSVWYRLEISLNDSATIATFILYEDDTDNILWEDSISENIPTTILGHGDLCFFRGGGGSYYNQAAAIDYMRLEVPNSRKVR